MVETALMILIVLLLLMGIIQFGFLFYAYARVSNATREGARAGSLWTMREYYSTICDQVESGVTSEIGCITEPPGVNCDIAITLVDGPVDPVVCAPADAEVGEPITVTVIYHFDLPVITALPIIREIIASPYPVSRTVVMRFQ